MGKLELEVGRFHCKKFRNFLNKCKFEGLDIDYYEGSGFASHEFIIKGNDNDIQKIYIAAKEYAGEVI